MTQRRSPARRRRRERELMACVKVPAPGPAESDFYRYEPHAPSTRDAEAHAKLNDVNRRTSWSWGEPQT